MVVVQSPRLPGVRAERLEETGAAKDAAIERRDTRLVRRNELTVEPDNRHAHMLTGTASRATELALPPMIVLEYVKKIPVGPVIAIGFVLIVFSMSRSVTATSFAPELVGLKSGAAQEKANSEGFTAKVETRPEGGVPGTVVAQDPVPGEALELGDTITIFVTQGADQKTIPDVTGMPVDQARQALRQAGVTPGDIVYRNEPSREPDRVISTNPPKGRTVDEGTIVEIVATAP